MMRARGFTLMEAALSMVLVGIIALAAIALYGSVTATFTGTRKTAMLNDRSQAAIDYLIHELRSVGGNGIPASAAFFVEDAAAARGEFPDGADLAAGAELRPAFPGKLDRVTTFTALQNVPPCPITAIAGPLVGGQGTAQFLLPAPRFPAGSCCFTMGVGRPFARTVMLMKDNNYRPVLLQNSSGTCTFQWQDIVPPSMRTVPTTGTVADAFEGGQAVLVDFHTLYVDTNTHDLIMHVDMPPVGGLMNALGASPTVVGERLRVLDGVYDFQASLGYDLDDTGDVLETGDGQHDEWLFNAPAENTGTFACPAGCGPFDPRKLRLVRIEIAVGLPTRGAAAGNSVASPARALGALKVPGSALRMVGTRLSPRNGDAADSGGP